MELGRLTRLEVEMDELAARVAVLERRVPHRERPVAPRREPLPAAPRAPLAERVDADARPAAEPAPTLRERAGADARVAVEPAPTLRERLGLAADDSLEDVLGGRVLAWVGGTAVFLGLLFLLAIAISNGWLGEGPRTLLAALASGGLLLGSVWLHERSARVDAARAAAAAGLAGLFATVTVAARLYALVPGEVGLVLALLVGAAATTLAIRWDSRGVAALGVLGAVAAPLLVDAGHAPGTLVILFVALAAAGGVLLWRRWDWLALAAFVLAAPQWIPYLFDGATTLSATLVLVAFGGLGVAMAVGYDVRVGSPGLTSQQAFLLALNAIAIAVAGWFAFDQLGEPAAGQAWLAALAVAHVAIGLGGARLARVSDELRLLALTLGIVLANVTFALVADGWVLALGWSAAGVAFAALERRVRSQRHDAAFVQGGLGGHLALALVQTLLVADPLAVLEGSAALSAAGAASLVALAAACLAAGRLVGQRDRVGSAALDVIGLAAVLLLTALTLDGTALVLAWVGEGLVLVRIARRFEDRVAAGGALAVLGLLVLHALTQEAPPASLASGLAAPFDAVVAVGSVAALALLGSVWLPWQPWLRLDLRVGGAVSLLYLASGLVVTLFADGEAVQGALLDSQQQGQLALSVLWALVGLGALVAGLRRDERALRVGALALLGVTVVKVFLLDLATLTSVYRVGSFIALGVLLLVGAFVWQQLRPRERPGGTSLRGR